MRLDLSGRRSIESKTRGYVNGLGYLLEATKAVLL